jgi:hypothetical protein
MIEDENDGYISDQTLESLYNNYLYGYLIGYEIYLIDKYTNVLDIYTIARSLKPINNSYDVSPIINICYFGDTHVKNITYFFTQIMKGYDIIFERPYKQQEITRCINIETYININDHIELLNDYRQQENLNSLGDSFRKKKQDKRKIEALSRLKNAMKEKDLNSLADSFQKKQQDKRKILAFETLKKTRISPPRISPPHVFFPENLNKERCMCINKSNGKRCENKQKTGLDYCGVHKTCKQPVQPQREPVQRHREPPQRDREPVQVQLQTKPIQRQREPLQKQTEEICLCTNKSANKRCLNRAKPGLQFCGVHRNCSKFFN